MTTPRKSPSWMASAQITVLYLCHPAITPPPGLRTGPLGGYGQDRHRARYRSAAYGQARALLDSHTCVGGEAGTGWDLHELRHSARTHLGESGVSLLLFMAKSRHKKEQHARRYLKPSAAVMAEVTAVLGPA